jgi:hypothetical protein
MRIVIDTDNKIEQQPQITKTNAPSAEVQHDSSTVVAVSSPIDAGHARVTDGNANDSTGQKTQQLPGNTSFPIAGAIDAGAPKVQQEVTVASAMPDVGNMETMNPANAFPAGAFSNSVHN